MAAITKNTGVIVEHVSKDISRILIAGNLVGLTIRLANGGWAVFDTEERRLSPQQFKRPVQCGKWLLEHLRSAQNG